MSEDKAIEIREMVDLDGDPCYLYAEEHHDRAEFLAALRDWERESCNEIQDLYRVEDVHHVWLGIEVADGEEVYAVVDADQPDTSPVTLVLVK